MESNLHSDYVSEMDLEIIEQDAIAPIQVNNRSLSPIIRSFRRENYDADIETTDERSRSPILSGTSTISYPELRRQSSPSASRSPSPDLLQPVQKSDSNKDCNETESGEDLECKCKCHDNKQTEEKKPIDDDDDDDGKLCPICFDVWDNSGDHRLCALRCGHLFGYSCVQRWISGQKTCPTCKRPVKKTDIRFIYAKKLIALDTSVLNELQLQLTTEKVQKNQTLFELAQSKQREAQHKMQIHDLNKQISILKAASEVSSSQGYTQSGANHSNVSKVKSFEISRVGGCRVMDYFKSSNTLVVSAHSPNPLFAGYGIKKVPITDPKSAVFIPLHSNTIRDLSFHPQTELLLSVGMDNRGKLTETANNKSLHSIDCSVPIWSCCWDASNPNYFFVGEQSGTVVKYDMRKLDEKLSVLQVPGDYSPVVSLASVGWNPDSNVPQGGLIVCKLMSCSIFVNDLSASPRILHPLGLDGPFVSMRYSNDTNHLLVSSRPNARFPFARHTLCTLASNSGTVQCNAVHTFEGAPVQKLLSKSCQMSIQSDTLVAAHHESQKVVDIWSAGSGRKVGVLPSPSPVVDLCPVQSNAGNFLCALNEKEVNVFKIDL